MPSFSTSLEQSIHAALALANERKHELATLEHLLLALIDEPDAARVMQACSVDIEALKETLVNFIDDDLSTLVTDIDGSEAVPTAAFQRVIQRAAIHVQSSGRTEVTGANVLVAIFAERESNAAYFLQEQDMTRYDAVNYHRPRRRQRTRPSAKRARSGCHRIEGRSDRGRARARPRKARWRNIASI